MSRHRSAPVRPRYGRMTALGSSLVVTTVAVLGGLGALPSAAGGDPQPATAAAVAGTTSTTGSTPSSTPTPTTGTAPSDIPEPAQQDDPAEDTTLPTGTGHDKRIVFSQSRQRVWLVSGGRHVVRTYLVSGSLTDNLHPGTYSVYSRSEQAWGIDDSGTMRYFVRFTQGDAGAAIGFHDIPIDEGKRVQTTAQLGTPQSHGCIRQKRSDAIALWNFAPLGTTVVVTA